MTKASYPSFTGGKKNLLRERQRICYEEDIANDVVTSFREEEISMTIANVKMPPISVVTGESSIKTIKFVCVCVCPSDS